MRGIRINFSTAGPSFDFTVVAQDFESTVQNALVNVATAQGSDPIFPDRGTDLLLDGVSGRLVNNTWANHSANFAAIATLVFSQSVDDPSDPHRMQNFTLKGAKILGQTLLLSAQATSADGQKMGILTKI